MTHNITIKWNYNNKLMCCSMLIKQLSNTCVTIFFSFHLRFLFPLDSLVRLKEQPCVPLFPLKVSHHPIGGTPICCHQLREAEDKKGMHGRCLGRRKSLWKSFGSGSFKHMSSGDIWHLSPFPLEPSSPQLLPGCAVGGG